MTETPLIRLDQVSIRHGAHVILQDIQVDVREGELVYLIGRTGSGKSSLLERFTETSVWRLERDTFAVSTCPP